MLSMSNKHTFELTVKATAMVEKFDLGSKPLEVMIINKTNGALAYWNADMADASAMVLIASVGSVGLKSANGISPVYNQYGEVDGFTLGLLQDFNTDADAADELALSVSTYPVGAEGGAV